MNGLILLLCVALVGCADHLPVVSNVTPFIPHVSRSNAEIIKRYKEARETGFSYGSAYAYARGKHTYTPEQPDILWSSELNSETQMI